MGKQAVVSHAKSSGQWTCTECSRKVGKFDHDWRVAAPLFVCLLNTANWLAGW